MSKNFWDDSPVVESGNFWDSSPVVGDDEPEAIDIDSQQEVITSARAYRGAGAGRGSPYDPRREDTRERTSVLDGVRLDPPAKPEKPKSLARIAEEDPIAKAARYAEMPSMTPAKEPLIPINEQGTLGRAGGLVGSQIDSYAAGLGRGVGDALTAAGATGAGADLQARGKAAQDRADRDAASISLSADGAFEKYAPQILAVFPTMAVAAASGGLPVMFGISQVQQYSEGRKGGLSPMEALARSIPMATAEVIGEKLGGTGKLIASLEKVAAKNATAKDLKDFGVALGSAGLREVPSEEATYAMQFAVDKDENVGLRQDATMSDFIEGAKDTAIVAAGAGGVMAGGAKALSKLPTPTQPLDAGTMARQRGFLAPQPATPSVTSFTDPAGPVGQAGITPVVVPVSAGTGAATQTTGVSADVSTATVSPALAAGGAPGGGDLTGGGVGPTGLASAGVAAGGAPVDTAVRGAGEGGPVPGAAGEPTAAVSPIRRTSDADLLSRVTEQPAAQPETTMMARSGQGYATQGDANTALEVGRKRQPELTWAIEPLDGGRFRVAGYATPGEVDATTAPVRNPQPATDGPAVQPQAAAPIATGQPGASGLPQPAAAGRADVPAAVEPSVLAQAGAGTAVQPAPVGDQPAAAAEPGGKPATGPTKLSELARSGALPAVESPHMLEPDTALQPALDRIASSVTGAFGGKAEVVFYKDDRPDAPNGFEYKARAYVNTVGLQAGAANTGWHESHHVLQRLAAIDDQQGRKGTPSQVYRDNVDGLFDGMSDQGKRNYVVNFLHRDELRKIADPAAREKRTRELMASDLTRREMVADFVGNRATDKTFIRSLAKADPKGFKAFAKRWLKVIDGLIAQLRGDGGNLESKAVDEYVADLKKARTVLRDAMLQLRKDDAPSSPAVAEDTVQRSLREPPSRAITGKREQEEAFDFAAFNLDVMDDAELQALIDEKDSAREKVGASDAALAIDFDALNAELDAQMAQQNTPKKAGLRSVQDVSDKEISDAGLHAEDVMPFGSITNDGRTINIEMGDGFPATYHRIALRSDGDHVTVDMTGTFLQNDHAMPTPEGGIAFVKRFLAGQALDSRGHDLAKVYRKGTIQKITRVWKAIAQQDGAFKLDKKDNGNDTLASAALDLGAFKGWSFDIERGFDGFAMRFSKPSGERKVAQITVRRDTMDCCTMGLKNSNLGTDFYAVAGEFARRKGLQFHADGLLSAVNTYRRTEQAASFALRSGNTSTLMPGWQNRVYGYNFDENITPEESDKNIARLFLANLRNVQELIPEIRRYSYDRASDTFRDAKGNNAADKIKAMLADQDVRAFGIGRSTLVRALMTSDIIKGTLTEESLGEFSSAPLYSKKEQPLSESWGEEGATTPPLKRFLGASVAQHKDGTPIVMFHGTARDIKEFRPQQAGAIYVTDRPVFAEDFALNSVDWMVSNAEKVLTPKQIEDAVNAAVAKVMADKGESMRSRKALAQDIRDRKGGHAKDLLGEELREQMPTGPNIMPLVVRAENPFDYKSEKHRNDVMALLDSQEQDADSIVSRESAGKISEHLKDGSWTVIESPEFQRAIRDAGHDGFYVVENGTRNLAVYSPNQVKSAIGNNGDYDLGDPDISRSKKQEPDTRIFRPASASDMKALKIPPGWTYVWVNKEADPKLLAVGWDSKDRAQYLYSKAHSEGALAKKFERQRDFHKQFPDIYARIDADANGGNEEAIVLRLIAHTGFRVGGDENRGETPAYGATTLKAEHVRIENGVAHFDFTGKLGVRQQHSVEDISVVNDIEMLLGSKGDGGLFDTNDGKVRRYLSKIAPGFKVHDFRTRSANDAVLAEMAAMPTPANPDEFWAMMDAAGDVAGRKIGDSRQIALESYVDPEIFDPWRIAAGVKAQDARPVKKQAAAAKPASAARPAGGVLRESAPVRSAKQKGEVNEQGREQPGDRGAGRGEGRSIAPLEGAPSVPGFSGPDPRLVEVAEGYAQSKGIKLKRQATYVKVDEARATRIAAAYEAMAHAPQDAAVQAAYADLIEQTTAQYRALEGAGYRFWFMDMSREDNQQYAASPWNSMRDIRANKRMGVFATNDGFGSNEEFDPEASPMLVGTGISWPVGGIDGPLQPVLANDLFRAVHDAFGHGLEGAGFRARGEENAWQAHSRLFTGPALGAITSETRGQNSWLNFGPHGEANRTANVEDTVFGDQKVGLMPEWTWTEGRADDEVAFSAKQRPAGLPAESAFMAFRRKIQDQFIQVRVVQDLVAGRGGVVDEEQDVYRAEERSHGRMQEYLIDFARNAIEPLMKKAAGMKIDMDELSLYAYAMHAKERNNYIRSINKTIGDAGSGMSDAEADGIIQFAALSGDKANFDSLQQDLVGIAETTRRLMLDEGLITQEQYDAWTNLYQHYVPLRGFENVDDDGKSSLRSGGRGFSMTGKESIRALGRQSRAGDILENIVRDYERAVIRSERNIVAKTFLDLATSNPDPDLWVVDPVKVNRSVDRLSGLVLMSNARDTGEDTFAIKVSGHEVRVKIKDDLLLRAMKGTFKDDVSGFEHVLATSLGPYTNLMRNTLTRYNPIFGAINAVRDAQMGVVATFDELGAEGAKLYSKYLPQATASAFRQERDATDVNKTMDRYLMEMRFAGGTTGGIYLRDTSEIADSMRTMLLQNGAAPNSKMERVRSSLAYRQAAAGMKWMEIIGATSETAARLAAYRSAREMGKTPAQAASISKNLTTNFNRKGEWGKAINTLYLFFNAAVQGNVRVLQALKKPRVRKLMAAVTGVSMGIALLNAGLGGDDDDGDAYWDKIPDYEKERNLIFMLPPGMEMDGASVVGKRGRYIKIPMPYGLNIFPVLGNQLADLSRYAVDRKRGVKPTKAAINLLSATLGSINPFGGAVDPSSGVELGLALLPTAGDAVLQLAAGVNGFGRPVGPEKSPFDNKPDSESFSARQAGGNSQNVARWLNSVTGGNQARSGLIDVMPGTLDNVVRNATGGLGVFVWDVLVNLPVKSLSPIEMTGRDIPLWRNFAGSIDDVTDTSLFYDRRKEVTKEADAAKAEMELGIEVDYSDLSQNQQAIAKVAESYTKWMTKLRKQEMEIALDPDATRGEKMLKRKELEKQRAELARAFNEQYVQSVKPLR